MHEAPIKAYLLTLAYRYVSATKCLKLIKTYFIIIICDAFIQLSMINLCEFDSNPFSHVKTLNNSLHNAIINAMPTLRHIIRLHRAILAGRHTITVTPTLIGRCILGRLIRK